MAGPQLDCWEPGHPYAGCSGCTPYLPETICTIAECEVCLPCYGEDEITCTFATSTRFAVGDPYYGCNDCVSFLPNGGHVSNSYIYLYK
jgi:hypothetical protein